MTIFRCLPPFTAALLLCLNLTARATSLAAEPSPKPSPTQTETQIGIQTQPATPIFSLGTISVAPSPQCFAGPASNAGVPQPSRTRRHIRRSRRIAEPVPLRTFSRA